MFMMGAIATDRIDGFGVACDHEGLAAAAAEVTFLSGAGEAGVGHPVGSAKTLERWRRLPYPGEVMFAHVVEG